jgi:zinc protease
VTRVPPAVVQPAAFVPPRFVRDRLPNGIPLLVAPRRGVPLVDVLLVLRAGAAHDPPALAGRAALAAALLEEGTTTRDATEIADAVEYLGATLDVRATWDACTIGVHVLAHRLPEALDALGDIARNATLPDHAFERKRAEHRADWLHDRAEPATLARECLHRAIYGDEHPYGAPLHGTDASLAGLTRPDVAAFHAAHAHAANAFIVIVGEIDAEAAARHATRVLDGWHTGETSRAVVPPPPAATPTIRIVPRPRAPQSEVRAGHAGPPRSAAEYFALIVLNTLLGGTFTSRLNQRLREEKGYTYGVRSGFAFRGGPGPFVISTAVSTDATVDTVREIDAQLRRIREERVAPAELERARHYLARGLPRRLEAGERHAAQLAQIELFDLGDDYLDRYVERVLDTTADDVLAAAQQQLHPDSLTVALAGDPARLAAGLSQLASGEILVESERDTQFRR